MRVIHTVAKMFANMSVLAIILFVLNTGLTKTEAQNTANPLIGFLNSLSAFVSVSPTNPLPTTDNDTIATSAGTFAPLLRGVQGGGIGTLPIPQPDAGNISNGNNVGTCAAACNGTNLFSVETSGFGGLVTIDFTAYSGTATINFQQSNDNVNWRGLECYSPGRTGTQTAAINAATAVYFCTAQLRYARANYGAYTSGTQTAFWNLRQNVTLPITLVPGVNFGAPLAGNSTGTTGAVVGTLTASAGRTAYICGFNVQATGTGLVGPVTVAGLFGSSQVYQGSAVAAGGQVAAQTFYPCIPASGQNTNITATTTADGTATAVNVNMWGFLL